MTPTEWEQLAFVCGKCVPTDADLRSYRLCGGNKFNCARCGMQGAWYGIDGHWATAEVTSFTEPPPYGY